MLLRRIVLPSLLVLPFVACSAAATPSSDATDAGAQNGQDSGAHPGQDASAAGQDSGAQPGQDAGAPDSGTDTTSDGGDAGEDLDMQASDFECILRWSHVGDYLITNKLGNMAGSLAAANAPDGAPFPVGTIIQLIPNEAMVKRHTGFNAASDDWEFFNLSTSASGTVINQRGGGSSVTNFTGKSCLDCHSGAAPQWDMVCGTTHGCAPLPINLATIQSIQNADPRCP